MLMAMEKKKTVAQPLSQTAGGTWCLGWQILTNLSRATRTVVAMEMVRLIWARGRMMGMILGMMINSK